jgi:hypothetical protein
MSDSLLRVFVSSTSKDLRAYRKAAEAAVLGQGWQPVMMEHMGTSPEATVDACRRRVEETDLLLLLVAFRRGWVPDRSQGGDGKRSITAYELETARHRGIPVRALLARETWPGNLWEPEQTDRECVLNFRANLNLPAEFFEAESLRPGVDEPQPGREFDSLLRKVLLDHRDWLRKQAPAGKGRPRRPIGAEAVLATLDPLLEGVHLSRAELLQAHASSAPPGWEPPPPRLNSVALLFYCAHSLARAPRQGGDDAFPLLRFVRWLNRQLTGEAAERLRVWLDDAIARLALDDADARRLRARLAAPAPRKGLASSLLVQVAPRVCDPGRYSLKAWLFGTGEPECLRAGEEAYARAELAACLDEIRDELARRRVAFDQIGVEFLLPRDLLCADVDQWPVRLDFIDAIPVGAEHRVVTRSLERASRPRAAAALRARWQRLRRAADARCDVLDSPEKMAGEALTAVRIDEVGCGGVGLYTALRDAPGLVCAILGSSPEPAPDDPNRDVLNTLLAVGIPVVVWARHPGDDAGAFRSLLCGLVGDEALPRLPDRVWNLRKAAVCAADMLHPGRHVSLVWDDPRRVPPDFDDKYRFTAPT